MAMKKLLQLFCCLSVLAAVAANGNKKYKPSKLMQKYYQKRIRESELAEAELLETNKMDLQQTPQTLTVGPRGGFEPPGPLNLKIRPGTTDAAVFNQIFGSWEYDEAIRKIWEMHEGWIPTNIVDAGANCGMAAAFFAAKYPQAQIVSIEPDDGNFAAIQSQGLPPQCHVLQGGVWSKDGVGLKLVDPNAPKWALRLGEVPVGTEGSVEGYTILGALKKAGMPTDVIDIVKMDIEGGEKSVFSDPNLNQWLDKTNVLILELHGDWQPGSDAPFLAVKQRTANVFDYFKYGENEVLVRKTLLEHGGAQAVAAAQSTLVGGK